MTFLNLDCDCKEECVFQVVFVTKLPNAESDKMTIGKVLPTLHLIAATTVYLLIMVLKL